MAKKITQRRKIIKEAPKECSFCKDNKKPDFLESETLGRFMTERGKIHPRSKSGLCAKHQKKLALEVKHARHLALLPFVVRPK